MPNPKVDYEALAKQYGGTTVKKSGTVDYSALAKQFGGTSTPAPDLTSNETGEGLYTMYGKLPGKGEAVGQIQIPYSKVPAAQQAGYAWSGVSEKSKYDKDKAAQGPSLMERYDTAVAPLTAIEPHGTRSLQTAVDFVRHPSLSTFAKGAAQEAETAVSNIGAGGLGVILHPVDTAAGLVKMAADPFVGMVHPEQTTSFQLGQQFAKQPLETLETMTGQTAAMDAAAKAAPGVAKAVADPLKAVKSAAGRIVRPTLETVTDTSPRQVREIAEEVQKKNADAAKAADDANEKAQKKYEDDKKEAEHTTTGLEIGRKYDIKQTAEEQAEAYRKDVEDVETYNTRVEDKANKKYLHDVDSVRSDNQKVLDKYNEEKTQIEDENTAAEHLLDMRRAEENALNRETAEYYAKEDEAKLKAKDDENKAWTPWHKQMDDVPVEVVPIQAKLEPILKVSPEATRAMNQLIPDPSDVDSASDYAKERARVMKSYGYGDNPDDYFKLDEKRRLDIDKATQSSGFQPDPVDLNPDASGKVPLKVIQRAQSIIGRNIAKGRYEGALLGEMKQLQSVLRGVVTKVTADNGASSLLDAARQATIEYQEAFGKERPPQKTLDELRQKGANPEEYKQQQDEERLAGAAKLSPDLVESYRTVKARRDALKKMKTEEQLRKSIQQVPQPPSVGDLRPGYNLKRFPVYEPPTIDDLRDGYRLKPRPTLPPAGSAARAVKEPPRVHPGPPPPPVVPETKTITPEDYQARQVGHIKATAKNLRSTGLRRAMYATLTGLPFAIHAAFVRSAPEAGDAALGGVAAGLAVLYGSHMLANLLDRPDVVSWISKVTPKDAAAWDKLPPEQKALFTQDMSQLVEAAKAKNIAVSPALSAFVAAGTGAKVSADDIKKKAAALKSNDGSSTPVSKPLTPEEVKKKAEELQESFRKAGMAR